MRRVSEESGAGLDERRYLKEGAVRSEERQGGRHRLDSHDGTERIGGGSS